MFITSETYSELTRCVFFNPAAVAVVEETLFLTIVGIKPYQGPMLKLRGCLLNYEHVQLCSDSEAFITALNLILP